MSADQVIHGSRSFRRRSGRGRRPARVDETSRRPRRGTTYGDDLLQASLRKILAHPREAGQFVRRTRQTPVRLFPLRGAFSRTLSAVEEEVNGSSSPRGPSRGVPAVRTAVAAGAMAFFGEVRGHRPDGDRPGGEPELCGGARPGHRRDRSLPHPLRGCGGRRVRRIEAVTGIPAWRCLREEAGTLHGVARELKVATPEVPERVRSFRADQGVGKALQEARRRSSRDLVGRSSPVRRRTAGFDVFRPRWRRSTPRRCANWPTR